MNDNALSFQNLKDSYPIRQNLYSVFSNQPESCVKKEEGNSFWGVFGVLSLVFCAFFLGLFWKDVNEYLQGLGIGNTKDGNGSKEKGLKGENSSEIEISY